MICRDLDHMSRQELLEEVHSMMRCMAEMMSDIEHLQMQVAADKAKLCEKCERGDDPPEEMSPSQEIAVWRNWGKSIKWDPDVC